jgi:hypothetical protein
VGEREEVMAAKIWVEVVLDSYFDPEGTVDALIASLDGLKTQYPDHKDFRVDKEYGGYDESDSFQLKASRLETDKEFDKRMKELEKKREKELYEKLKKKFEKAS